MTTVVALVPARAGSQRVPGKNILPLAGRPLIAHTIDAARASGIFTDVVVSTDSEEIAAIARAAGASVPFLRRAEIATSTSPDIEWVLEAMKGRSEDAFAILRPTSPFRSAATIRRAWTQLLAAGDDADSIRAVERVRQHPGKMWVIDGPLMRPLLDRTTDGTPWHSMQYQALPEIYVQNSSLEIAWRHVLEGDAPTISGTRVLPFLTEPLEGFTIDYPEDVARAESLAANASTSVV
jgi:CMP-N-acetylneuraminic acid synthetase